VDGEFDVVVMGYVLQMLRDPLRALAAIRSVCRGHLLLLDTVSLPLSLLPAPIARLDARRGDRPGAGASDSWGHRLGTLGRSCAIRAHSVNI
jgi:hypothetical protein